MLMTLLQTRLKICNSNWTISTRFKGLKLNTDKTKVMVFFSRGKSAISTFTYDGTPLELVTEFKYLTCDGSMLTAAKKTADNFRSAIARVYRIGDSKGIKHRKQAMLWLFQVFALTDGLYGCYVWATSSLTYDSSKITPTHVLHLGFLKRLLGVKKSTDTHCVLRKTGQMPIFFYWFRCIIRFWKSLLSLKILFLRKFCRLTLLLQIEAIHGLIRFCTHSKISLHLSNFWMPYDLEKLSI